MNTTDMLEVALFVQATLSVAVLAAMFWRRVQGTFSQLATYLAAETVSVSVTIALLFFRAKLGLTLEFAYPAYFAASWIFTGIALLLRILIVYSVFGEAMRPMSGLHQAGKIIFKWVAVVSILVAFALLAGPGVFSSKLAWLNILSHLQQGVSVLTLCLLVFVCFAVRPLGLTFRSHIFGVSLGLGITATVELIQAAWLITADARSLYSPIYLFSSLGYCAALLTWGTYFALPEPPRKMILLPTTSPFFFWNRISEILGDSPGHVAVAGFTPSMLAPAEIEMLTDATAGDAHSELPQPLQPPGNRLVGFGDPARLPSAKPAEVRELVPGPQLKDLTSAEIGGTIGPSLVL